MKIRIPNYTFDASAKTVTFTDYASIRLDSVLIIVSVTDNIIIYNFADTAKGGTVATNVLTLEYDTTAMDDTDKLLIYYDTPSAVVDSAFAANDEGFAIRAIRDDALTILTPVDGDYVSLRTDRYGALWVTIASKLNSTEDSVSAVVTNMTPGTAATDLGKAEDAAHSSGDSGVMMLGVANTANANISGTTLDYTPISTDLSGAVRIIGTVAADAAVAGFPVLNGARASTATPTAMSADGDSVYIWATRNGAMVIAGEIVDDAAFGVATSRVIPAGFLADETSTDSVDEGDAGAARITLDRKQIVANYAHPSAGGWTPHKLISAATTNATSLKGSAGQVGSFQVFNLNAAARYLKFYNKATAPTVGTDVPVKVIMIPGNTAGAGVVLGNLPGIQFSTGIAYALTTGIADSDTTAVAANEIIVNIDWI